MKAAKARTKLTHCPKGFPIFASTNLNPPFSGVSNPSSIQSAHLEKRSYRIKDLVAVTGLAKSSINRLIAAGKIRIVKSEGSTLILKEDLDAYYATLRAA